MLKRALHFLCLMMLLVPAVARAQVEQAPPRDVPPGRARKALAIGVVIDGASDRLEAALQIVQQEVEALTGNEFDVSFPPDKKLISDWKRETIERDLDRLLADDSLQMVLAFGVIASNLAVQRPQLPKPTIAPFVVDERLQGLLGPDHKPVIRPNLSYIVWPLDLARDLRAFSELVDFERVGYIHNGYLTPVLPKLLVGLVEEGKQAGVVFVPVAAGNTAQSILDALPAGIDSVYVGPNTQLPHAEFEKLARGLLERRLPSFAWFGKPDVERGFLAGLAPEDDVIRLARRVALNAQSILLGDDPSSLITAFNQQEQLSLNMRTARALGVWPNWSVLTDAVLVNNDRKRVERQITLQQAIDQAMRSNLDLAAMRQAISASHLEIKKARSNLLPHVGLSASATVIDADRAGFGNSQYTIAWGGSLTQAIYDQRAWANVAIQKELHASQVQQQEVLRLDVALQVADTYLNLLQAQTVERIRRENLALSRENLALARLRNKLGMARPGEVLRWEAEISNTRRDLIAAAAARNQLEILLNRLLNRPLEEAFVTRETRIDDPQLLASEERFRQYLNNPFRFKTMREFLVEEGVRQSPELRQVQSALNAVDRRHRSAKRSLYVPSVGFSAGATHKAYQAGAGSDPVSLPPGVDIEIPDPNNVDWYVGLSANIPLYDGSWRYAEIEQSKHEFARLNTQKDSIKLSIAQRVRSALHQLGASFAAIRLSRDAARAAKENLTLVSDAYSRGSTSIITLLDAQNQALVADLAASNATYQFLADLMIVERSIGSFDFFSSQQQRNALFERLDGFSRREVERQGARPAQPIRKAP